MISPFDGSRYVEHSSGNRNRGSLSIGIHPRRRLHSGFFIRPHLHIKGKLGKRTVRVRATEGGLNSVDEEFDVIIWTIQIVNRFARISQIVNKCLARMYLDLIGEEIALLWRSSQGEDTQVGIRASTDEHDVNAKPRDRYTVRFGASYASRVTWRSLETVDIPPSAMGELYFLITFRDSEFAFLVTKDERIYTDWYDSDGKKTLADKKNAVFLLFEKGKEYKLHLRFEGDGYYENRGRILKVKIESWDDIRLES